MPKTLLLADDSITIQKVVGIIFASEDYSVTTVDNGEDALSKARELKPDVLLADVVMPRKNGYELCEAMKNDAALRDTPVVLLAGTFEAFDEARAKAVRADGWIQKPFESSALVAKVREIVEGIAPAAAPSLPYVTAAPARPTAPTVVPPPRGAPPPPGVRPLPGASAPATEPQPWPAPPPAPFAARPPMAPVPPVPPPPPFAARPPSPPAPPIPAPTFRAPPPPPPPVAAEPPRPAPSFAAPPAAQPPAPFSIPPLPPPPPLAAVTVPPPTAAPFAAPPPPLAVPVAAPSAPVASLDELDFSGASFDEPLTPPTPPPPPVFAAPPPAVTVPPPTAAPFAAPPPPLAVPIAPPAPASFAAPLPLPAPSSPPPAPAIPTQKVAPPVEPEAELDFDIDEAAAPIDLADLAAEEISDEEAFSTGEVHADVTPLAPAAPAADPFADLFGDEGRTPPALELHAHDAPVAQAREPDLAEGLPSLDLDADAEQLPTLELEPEAELPSLDMASGDEPVSPLDLGEPPFEREPELPAAEGDSPFRLDADPRPYRPVVAAPSFDAEDLGPRPFELEAARDHEPAFTAMPGFPPAQPAPELEAAAAAAPQREAELPPPPPIAMAADEAVLREALSRASQETIERVVWEVVPQLAETIIREHLERLMKDRKIS